MSAVLPIEEDPRFRLYTASAGQTQFAVNFPFQQSEDIGLYSRDLSGGWVEISPTLYDITGAGTANGGMATFHAGRLAGDKLLVLSTTVLDRLGSIVRDGRFNSRLTDDEFDRGRLIQQDLRRDVDRALKTDFGGDGLTIDPDIGDGDTLIRNGDRLSKGPNAADIAGAQEQAEIAVAAAGAANASAVAAAGSATSAGNSATDAGNAAGLAARWANEDEDVPVLPGLYSAYHWARKAAASVMGGVAAAIHAAAAKAAIADDDEIGLADSADGWVLKKFSLANLISSIFKTTRKIANAYFVTSFRLWDAADPTKGLRFDLSAVSAGQVRKMIMADGDVDLGKIANIGGTGELTLSTNAIDILSIPASARSLTLVLSGVTLSAAQQPIVLFGTSAGFVTAGYVTAAAGQAATSSSAGGLSNAMPLSYTTGGAGAFHGVVEFRRIGQSNAWSYEGTITAGLGALSNLVGNIVLADTLTRVRLTTVSGTPTFAGKASLDWE